jgi:hypothetical protein
MATYIYILTYIYTYLYIYSCIYTHSSAASGFANSAATPAVAQQRQPAGALADAGTGQQRQLSGCGAASAAVCSGG